MCLVLHSGVYDPCLSRVGSRPGDPLGGELFNVLETIIHRKIRAQLVQEDLLTMLPVPSHGFSRSDPYDHEVIALCDDTYVDDDAFAITSHNAVGHLPKLSATTRVVSSVFRSHGMPLNFKSNKLKR